MADSDERFDVALCLQGSGLPKASTSRFKDIMKLLVDLKVAKRFTNPDAEVSATAEHAKGLIEDAFQPADGMPTKKVLLLVNSHSGVDSNGEDGDKLQSWLSWQFGNEELESPFLLKRVVKAKVDSFVSIIAGCRSGAFLNLSLPSARQLLDAPDMRWEPRVATYTSCRRDQVDYVDTDADLDPFLEFVYYAFYGAAADSNGKITTDSLAKYLRVCHPKYFETEHFKQAADKHKAAGNSVRVPKASSSPQPEEPMDICSLPDGYASRWEQPDSARPCYDIARDYFKSKGNDDAPNADTGAWKTADWVATAVGAIGGAIGGGMLAAKAFATTSTAVNAAGVTITTVTAAPVATVVVGVVVGAVVLAAAAPTLWNWVSSWW